MYVRIFIRDVRNHLHASTCIPRPVLEIPGDRHPRGAWGQRWRSERETLIITDMKQGLYPCVLRGLFCASLEFIRNPSPLSPNTIRFREN